MSSPKDFPTGLVRPEAPPLAPGVGYTTWLLGDEGEAEAIAWEGSEVVFSLCFEKVGFQNRGCFQKGASRTHKVLPEAGPLGSTITTAAVMGPYYSLQGEVPAQDVIWSVDSVVTPLTSVLDLQRLYQGAVMKFQVVDGPHLVSSKYGGNWGEALDAVDLFQPYMSWPKEMRQLYFKSHKTNPERFELFMFFWTSGMPPVTAGLIVLGVPAGNFYDGEAYRQVAYLAINAKNYTLVARKWYSRYTIN